MVNEGDLHDAEKVESTGTIALTAGHSLQTCDADVADHNKDHTDLGEYEEEEEDSDALGDAEEEEEEEEGEEEDGDDEDEEEGEAENVAEDKNVDQDAKDWTKPLHANAVLVCDAKQSGQWSRLESTTHGFEAGHVKNVKLESAFEFRPTDRNHLDIAEADDDTSLQEVDIGQAAACESGQDPAVDEKEDPDIVVNRVHTARSSSSGSSSPKGAKTLVPHEDHELLNTKFNLPSSRSRGSQRSDRPSTAEAPAVVVQSNCSEGSTSDRDDAALLARLMMSSEGGPSGLPDKEAVPKSAQSDGEVHETTRDVLSAEVREPGVQASPRTSDLEDLPACPAKRAELVRSAPSSPRMLDMPPSTTLIQPEEKLASPPLGGALKSARSDGSALADAKLVREVAAQPPADGPCVDELTSDKLQDATHDPQAEMPKSARSQRSAFGTRRRDTQQSEVVQEGASTTMCLPGSGSSDVLPASARSQRSAAADSAQSGSTAAEIFPAMPVEGDSEDGDDGDEQLHLQDQSQVEEMWACPRCTLLNVPMALSCEACGLRRQPAGRHPPPTDGLRAAGDEGLQVGDVGGNEGRGDALNQVWQCFACTFENSMAVSICAVCGTPHADVAATVGTQTPRQLAALEQLAKQQCEGEPLQLSEPEARRSSPPPSKSLLSAVWSAMFGRCSKSSSGQD